MGKQFNYSHRPTQPNSSLVNAQLEHFWCSNKPRVDMDSQDSQDSPQLRLGGNHHLPPYIIICAWPRGQNPNVILSQTPKIGTFVILEAYNFVCRPPIEVRFKAKLYPLSIVFQRYVTQHLCVRKLGRLSTFNGQEAI